MLMFWRSYRLKRSWGWPRRSAFLYSWALYVWWPIVDKFNRS